MVIEKLSLSFGSQVIFDDINITIPNNKKVGIVGLNGAGKTTFFKIIIGSIEADYGVIKIDRKKRIALLTQVIESEFIHGEITVLDYLLSGRPIKELKNNLQKLYDEAAKTSEESLLTKAGSIQSQLDYWEEYEAESQLLNIISGMNIEEKILFQNLSELSGGQKSKVAFARLLYSKPDILLLDEPTNHLDKSSIEYVKKYLKSYKGSVYVISHDQSFLNSVTNHILYLNKSDHKMYLYEGNYDGFIKIQKANKLAMENKKRKENEIEKRLTDFIERNKGVSGKRKKLAQSREKALKKLQKNKTKIDKTSKLDFKITINKESSNIPLRAQNLSFGYDESNSLFEDLNFTIYKGERFLIVGENGIGKSTLLKLIVGKLKTTSGDIEIGKNVEIAYYAQEHELLDEDKTIIENLGNSYSLKKLRALLGKFLFYGDDVFKKVNILSPGEKSRVALAKLTLNGANTLILDEPTNHLDPETQILISDAFSTFPGTILVVSHNPDFVDNLGIERILLLPSGKTSYYNRETVEFFEEVNTKTPGGKS